MRFRESHVNSTPVKPFEPVSDWSVDQIHRALLARGPHPAIVSFAGEKKLITTSIELAEKTNDFRARISRFGKPLGSVIGICGPNGADWVAAALASLMASFVLMPLDNQASTAELVERLRESDCRLLFVSEERRHALKAELRGWDIDFLFLDGASRDLEEAEDEETETPSERAPSSAPRKEDTAVRFFTSGTTGKPKSFLLSHGNLGENVRDLAALDIVGVTDRTLVPLPLYHAYPFVVGMLTALTVGTTIIFPEAISGPEIITAIRLGRPTAIVAVPGLYETFVTVIENRIAARGAIVRLGFSFLTALSRALQRHTGLALGRPLFRPLRDRLSPGLRILVSGGARLDPKQQEKLEAWGWMVLVGYGLAETASAFTCSGPAARRVGSAGTPIGSGVVRIAEPDPNGIGEIELRGPQITAGYLNNPDANARAFTADGWFRTGDLGRLEKDGSLTVTGRTKEMIVLSGGKNLNPEELEGRYLGRPEIEEIAIIEHDGSLVAIVRPNMPALRAFGATSARDGIRIVLAEQGQGQRPYERLVGFALTDRELPKTRLGKYQRFKLPALYEELCTAAGGPPQVQLSDSDRAFLGNPVAATFWDVLRERFPGKATSLAKNPHLDLNLDSFGWMELNIEIENRLGAPLSEDVMANAETLRGLIEAYMATDLAGRAAEVSTPAGISTDVEYWLQPTGAFYTVVGLLLSALNWCLMRALFRLRSVGLEHLPETGAFIIAPNHVSDLDAFAVCGVLPLAQLRRTYWAGDIKRLFENPLQRVFSRISHVFPVGDGGAMYPIKAAITVLRSGKCLGWFPEGWRSPDGTLQAFMPGIGMIMRETDASAVPTYIAGAAEALPRGRYLPSFRQITVVFGRPATFSELESEGAGNTVDERIADGLRKRMIVLEQTYRIGVA